MNVDDPVKLRCAGTSIRSGCRERRTSAAFLGWCRCIGGRASRRRAGRSAWAFALVGALIAGSAAVTAVSPPSAQASEVPSADRVRVADGILQGADTAAGRSFLNVPFAAPPIGPLRFRPPRPAMAWRGVRDATKPGNICPQTIPTGLGPQSEDCLTLDVHVPPGVGVGKLPVMVWFYGGGFQIGAASGYDPTPLVTKGHVIVVTVNYRLGAYGFLALPSLKSESHSTGNYGTLDQQASLRWVSKNIGAFGGDPHNVTIFGQSAGGNSVCDQVVSPTAAGLFQRAISQSGSCTDSPVGPATLDEAYSVGQAFAKHVNCSSAAAQLQCLRRLSTKEIASFLLVPSATSEGWAPTIDGSVIKSPVREALAAGHYNHVPLMLGSNKDEMRLFIAIYNLLLKRTTTPAILKWAVALLAPNNENAVLAAYPPASPTDADVALASVFTDWTMACPAATIAKTAAAQPGQSVYQYEFADPQAPGQNIDPLMPMGDFHGAELPYLFSKEQGLASPALSPAANKLSDAMISYWSMFAKTGNPNSPGEPVWPAVTSSRRQVQRLTSQGTATFSSFTTAHHCELWR
jgi:para-nitrobenzyl esterase